MNNILIMEIINQLFSSKINIITNILIKYINFIIDGPFTIFGLYCLIEKVTDEKVIVIARSA